ncbi:MAG: pyruvate dehydrogenase (acetyl-transferring) E1 component subunit alpha [Flavobacteriaceae bacterium]|nr:MAG: pyruvate dehydrogenase (acetyl-transferring) E1 component subunit alpha [Flavobacteriaceae bacterium]
MKNDIHFAPFGEVDDNIPLPLNHHLDHTQIGLSADQVIQMYRLMQLQRKFEERAMQQYQKGKFGGFLHLYSGQEAVSTGCTFAFQEKDDVLTTYRDHGWGLCRGISANQGMAELFGKATGCCKGKGGSMHFSNPSKHFWGGFAIVGAHIPLAAGLAFANKYKQTGQISTCFFGDGATDQGALHETLNIAKLWELPVLFAIENNGYSMGTARKRHSVGQLSDRAKGFEIQSRVINGMDVFEVYQNMKEISQIVRETHQPWLVEFQTYRYRGHSMSDPQKYRSKEEMETFKSIDPIDNLKKYMLDREISTSKILDEIDQQIDQEILASIEFADNSPTHILYLMMPFIPIFQVLK